MTGSLKDEPSNGGHDWYQSGAPYEQSGDDPLHCQTALIVWLQGLTVMAHITETVQH